MFLNLASRLRKEIEDVKSVVSWQEALRSSLNSIPGAATEIALDVTALEVLKQRAPFKLAWQIFDHYAAVTYIYASFEKAICGLVEDYIGVLPSVYGNYENLHEKVRIQHRIGVGQVLSKWNPWACLEKTDIKTGII